MNRKLNKSALILFIIAVFYTFSLIIVPLTLEPGTVTELDGSANMIVYGDKWRELPIYHRIVYTFSDFNCHQKYYRSYSINGNQMPVCSRCFGIFLGIPIGFAGMMFITPKKDYKDLILSPFKIDLTISEKKKIGIIALLGAIFVLPMALDGGLQLISSYESTNPVRTTTGLLFGIAFSVFISSILISSFSQLD
ncbi:MAG: DUF2085 domain-containing protein [Thermoplasmatota archaeon]